MSCSLASILDFWLWLGTTVILGLLLGSLAVENARLSHKIRILKVRLDAPAQPGKGDSHD